MAQKALVPGQCARRRSGRCLRLRRRALLAGAPSPLYPNAARSPDAGPLALAVNGFCTYLVFWRVAPTATPGEIQLRAPEVADDEPLVPATALARAVAIDTLFQHRTPLGTCDTI